MMYLVLGMKFYEYLMTRAYYVIFTTKSNDTLIVCNLHLPGIVDFFVYLTFAVDMYCLVLPIVESMSYPTCKIGIVIRFLFTSTHCIGGSLT